MIMLKKIKDLEEQSKQDQINLFELKREVTIHKSENFKENREFIMLKKVQEKLINEIDSRNKQIFEKMNNFEGKSKELEIIMNKLQHFESQEMSKIKYAFQQKISDDEELFQKEKEKGKILFQELTRLGNDFSEFQNTFMLEKNELIQKINHLENQNGEFNNIENSMNSKKEQTKNLLSKMNDKFEIRLNDLEEQILKLTKKNNRNEDQFNKIENGVMTQFEDLREAFEQKMNINEIKFVRKIKDLENDLKKEKESRDNNQEYIKELLNAKYSSFESRLKDQEEEHKKKFSSNSNMINEEINRREDQINKIQNELEKREKFWGNKLRKTESEIQEFFQKSGQFFEKSVHKVNLEIEEFKKQFSDESEKVADLVSQEIQARFSSDV